jgi:hypothetical protein
MSAKAYTVYVYKSTAPDTSTAHVAFTLTDSRLSEAPTVRRPLIRPLYGRSESQPWYVDVLDVGSSFSALLASSGRYDKLGRLLQVRCAKDGSTAVKLGTGRITNTELLSDVAGFRVTVEDERTLERQTNIFTTNTTRLFPAGVHAIYGPFGPPSALNYELRASTASAKWRRLKWSVSNQEPTGLIRDALADDVVADPHIASASTVTGLFRHARIRLNGVDYPIRNFPSRDMLDYNAYVQDPLKAFTEEPDATALYVWVGMPSGFSTAGQGAFLHAMTLPPTDLMPLHIGGRSGRTLQDTIVAVYNGDYSSSGAKLPRYSTAALDSLPRDVRVRYRLTGPMDMAEWLEDFVYMPHGLVPSVNSDGQVIIKQTFWPGSTSAITYSYTGANLAEHPTWSHQGREQVTRVKVRYTVETFAQGKIIRFTNPLLSNPTQIQQLTLRGPALDRLEVVEREHPVEHDLSTRFKPREVELLGHGWHRTNTANPVNADQDQVAIKNGTKYGRELLNRFGDGPVYGSLMGLTSAESVEPGDWVKVTLGTYPNPSVPGRGGTRFVQVFGRTDQPDGPTHDYLDGGAANNPLTSPSITLSTSTADSRHQVRVTLGSITAGGYAECQIAASSTTPAATSTKWTAGFTTDTTGVTPINQRASGTKYYGRARNQHINRIPSAWVVSTGKTTASLTAPSGLGSTGINGAGFTALWSIGTVGYPLEMFIDTSTAAAFSTANQLARLPAGTRRYVVSGGLALDTTYAWGVRHIDLYGGASTAPRVKFATSTVAPASPTMLGLETLLAGPF